MADLDEALEAPEHVQHLADASGKKDPTLKLQRLEKWNEWKG